MHPHTHRCTHVRARTHTHTHTNTHTRNELVFYLLTPNADFDQGWIQFDNKYTSGDATSAKTDGAVPDGEYGENTKMFFCCRQDGSPRVPAVLPNTQPFVLFPVGSRCQRVEGESWRPLTCLLSVPNTQKRPLTCLLSVPNTQKCPLTCLLSVHNTQSPTPSFLSAASVREWSAVSPGIRGLAFLVSSAPIFHHPFSSQPQGI